MAGKIWLENFEEIRKQAQALGPDAKKATNKALLAGAKIIASEAGNRIPRYAKYRSDHGRSSKHLADSLKADVVSSSSIAGVTVEGGFNGPSFYVKFVEYGTSKMSARQYIGKSAAAREDEVLDTITSTLKDGLGL